MGHQLRESNELALVRLVSARDERDAVHACRRGPMLAEQLEAREIDEHVREQVRPLDQHARELRHDLAGLLDAWR